MSIYNTTTYREKFQPIDADTLEGNSAADFAAIGHPHPYIPSVPTNPTTTYAAIGPNNTVTRLTGQPARLLHEEYYNSAGSFPINRVGQPYENAQLLEFILIGGGGGGGAIYTYLNINNTPILGAGAAGGGQSGTLVSALVTSTQVDFDNLNVTVGAGGNGAVSGNDLDEGLNSQYGPAGNGGDSYLTSLGTVFALAQGGDGGGYCDLYSIGLDLDQYYYGGTTDTVYRLNYSRSDYYAAGNPLVLRGHRGSPGELSLRYNEYDPQYGKIEVTGGYGGATPLGYSGNAKTETIVNELTNILPNITAPGQNGIVYGGGGSGAAGIHYFSSTLTGGNGASGLVILRWYIY